VLILKPQLSSLNSEHQFDGATDSEPIFDFFDAQAPRLTQLSTGFADSLEQIAY
jgi:hypothetical protein